jgi:DNA-binding transcriptional LysR family regulator
VDILGAMKIFAKVVETGSFSETARALGLAPSSVSRQMDSLEEEMGARLLQRTTRRVSLTEPGKLYLSKVEEIMIGIDEAKNIISILQTSPRGTLRVGLPVSFGRLHVAPLLSKFLKKYPEVKLDLIMNDSISDIVAGEIDVTIRIGESENSSSMSRKILTLRRMVCATPSYLAQFGTPKKPSELANHNCVSFNYGPGSDIWYFKDRKEILQSVKVSGRVQVNNGEVVKQALLDGIGIGLLPAWLIGPEVKSGKLEVVLPQYRADIWAQGDVGVYALYPNNRHLSPKVRVFIDFLVNELEKRPELV